MRTSWIVCVVSFLVWTLPGAARAMAVIDRSVLSAGGGFVSSATHSVYTVIGEPIAGPATSPSYSIMVGFLAAPATGSTGGTDLPSVSRVRFVAPNPFQGRTTIAFDLATSSQVAVNIYDTSGRLLKVLANGTFSPARYTLEWDGTDLNGRHIPPGIYYCQFRGGVIEAVHRIVYIR